MKNSNWYKRAMQGLNARNNSRFSYATGDGQNKRKELSGASRTFGLIATSTTNAAATAVFFGYGAQGDAQNAGSGDGIAITGIGALGHGAIKRITADSNYKIEEIRLRGNAAATIPTTITIRYQEVGGGKLETYEIVPRIFQGSSTQDATRAEIPLPGGLKLHGGFQLNASIAANGTLDVYIIVSAGVDLSNALDDEDVISRSYEPMPPVGPAQRLVVESAAYNKSVR